MKRALIISLGRPLAVAACGDDGDNPMTDAAVADAPPDAPPPFKGFAADEGGEIRIEYIKAPNGNAGTRVFSFFLKNAGTPAYHDFISLNGCTDARAGSTARAMNWPFALSSDAEFYDVGEAIYVLGGPQPLKVPKNATTGPDPLSRPMPANTWYFDPIDLGNDTDGATYLSPATTYDVALPGSATFAPQYFANSVYIPQDFNLLSPGNEANLTFPANTDQTFTWEEKTETLPPDATLFSLLGFFGANGFAVICVEKDDGSMTVPAAMMDIALAAYPTGGFMARQKFVHQPADLLDAEGKSTGRRVDIIGVWCYAGTQYGPE